MKFRNLKFVNFRQISNFLRLKRNTHKASSTYLYYMYYVHEPCTIATYFMKWNFRRKINDTTQPWPTRSNTIYIYSYFADHIMNVHSVLCTDGYALRCDNDILKHISRRAPLPNGVGGIGRGKVETSRFITRKWRFHSWASCALRGNVQLLREIWGEMCVSRIFFATYSFWFTAVLTKINSPLNDDFDISFLRNMYRRRANPILKEMLRKFYNFSWDYTKKDKIRNIFIFFC